MKIADQFYGAPSEGEDTLTQQLKVARYRQQAICARVDTFFAHASAVLEGRLQTNYWDGFMDRLGSALKARGEARHMSRN